MYKGKRVKSHMPGKRGLLLLVSILMLLTATVAGTLAYIATETDPVTNTFEPVQMPNYVVEDFSGMAKNDVAIQNDSTKSAYIRATIVATWAEVDTNGNPTGNVYAGNPVEDTDYSMTWTMDGWVKRGDYYYYTRPVAAGDETGVLFTNCTQLKAAPTGYKLSIEIMGQSIQADGVDSDGNKPVELAWGVDITGGQVVAATIS